jgi:RNA polymerase sigma-70 factor (ECF subfamily)
MSCSGEPRSSDQCAVQVHRFPACGVYVCKADTEREAMAASASFEEFYAATVDRLLGQLFLVTGDLHLAEEIIQEAFTRASMRWSHLRDYDRPEAWVRRVAMNLAADRARSLRRQTRALLKLGPPPAMPAVSVETLVLVQALRTLPVRQRQAIVLHYLADLPVAEIAQALDVPSGTVKSLLARGRRALAAKLGEPEEVFDRA